MSGFTASTMMIGDHKFLYREGSTDEAVVRQVFEREDYSLSGFAQERAFYNWMERKVGKPLIIDCGSNVGASVLWFQRQFEDALVVGIEPDLNNFALLKVNTPGAKHYLGAVGSHMGFGSLVDPGRGEWAYRVDMDNPGDSNQVKVLPIQYLLDQHVDHYPLIAKIDIEGGEAELFADNCDWVHQFPLIIIELHDWMLPGQAVSATFFNALLRSACWDIVMRGENVFAFNCDLLY